MTSILEGQVERQAAMQQTIAKLENENIKLRSEMKILRNEHTEVLYVLHGQEK